MNNFRGWRAAVMLGTVLLGIPAMSCAQGSGASDDALAQANNPLANFTALNVHNY